MPSLDVELKQYFTKGAKSIKTLLEYHDTRVAMLKAIAKTWASADVIGMIAPCIALTQKSHNDEVADGHTALIEVLNQELTAWSKLQSEIEKQNADAVKGFVKLLEAILKRELRLMPATADAQAVFVKMTPAQMKRAAAA